MKTSVVVNTPPPQYKTVTITMGLYEAQELRQLVATDGTGSERFQHLRDALSESGIDYQRDRAAYTIVVIA